MNPLDDQVSRGLPLRDGVRSSRPPDASRAEAWQMLAGLMEAARVMPDTLRAPAGSLPLTILAGFLGAGKTTLLNHLLRHSSGRRLAVLVNDFGRLNIDAALIRSRTEDMISLANGCVCCTVSSELTRTLIELAQRADPPDALVLEASGLADPRGIAQVALANPALRLDGVLTVVDALGFDEAITDAAAATIDRQCDAADLFVLTKTDEVDAGRQAAIRAQLARRFPRTPIATAVHGDLPAHVVLGIGSARDPRRDPPAPWTHSAAFGSWSLQADAPLDRVRLEAFLNELPATLLRAKGVLHLAQDPGRRYIHQRVGRRARLDPQDGWGDEPPASSLVLIGPSGCLDAELLADRFASLAQPPHPPS